MSFRRGNMNADFVPNWRNLDFGRVPNRGYGLRFLKMVAAVGKVLACPKELRDADVIVARNLDLLAIAWLTRMLLFRGQTPIVYECLDIHGFFMRADHFGAFMRWTERRLLAHCKLLIVSSPRFVESYFSKIQGYVGPVSVIENKLWFDGPVLPRPRACRMGKKKGPIVLGWVGSIRCHVSLGILVRTAQLMGERLEIRIHGNIHHHALSGFDAAISERPNINWYGAYRYPEDLAEIYRDCDLVWAQDLWQRPGNSDWLLPNRIYEASWFGCPSVAVADTETGRRIIASQLGLTIRDADASELANVLSRLTHSELQAMSQHILGADDSEFLLEPEDVGRALLPVLPLADMPSEREVLL